MKPLKWLTCKHPTRCGLVIRRIQRIYSLSLFYNEAGSASGQFSLALMDISAANKQKRDWIKVVLSIAKKPL